MPAGHPYSSGTHPAPRCGRSSTAGPPRGSRPAPAAALRCAPAPRPAGWPAAGAERRRQTALAWQARGEAGRAASGAALPRPWGSTAPRALACPPQSERCTAHLERAAAPAARVPGPKVVEAPVPAQVLVQAPPRHQLRAASNSRAERSGLQHAEGRGRRGRPGVAGSALEQGGLFGWPAVCSPPLASLWKPGSSSSMA